MIVVWLINGFCGTFRKAKLELAPSLNYAYNNRSLAKIHKGDYAGALTDLSHAVGKSPSNAVYVNNLGLANLVWVI